MVEFRVGGRWLWWSSVWEGDDYGGGSGKRLYTIVMNTLVYLLQVVKTINIYLHTMFDISNNTIRPTILIIYAYSLTPAVVLSMLFMLTLNIVIVCGLFEQGFFLSFVIQYYRYRFNYQEGCWDHINRFNPTTCVYLSQARTWDSSVKCGDFFFMFNELRWEMNVHFVDIGWVIDHHFLNFLFIIIQRYHIGQCWL
jgi:hypothetical protein